MFEYMPEAENESAVTIIYAMEEVDEYTAEDIMAPITGDKAIYETTDGFSDVVYQETRGSYCGSKADNMLLLDVKKEKSI